MSNTNLKLGVRQVCDMINLVMLTNVTFLEGQGHGKVKFVKCWLFLHCNAQSSFKGTSLNPCVKKEKSMG